MAFHVNPKTGNTGVCKAKTGPCPFGGADEHFDSREAAQANYEKKQEKIEWFLNKTKVPPTKGAYTLLSYDPMDEDVPVGGLWGNKIYSDFSKKMAEAEPGTRLVIENGAVLEKSDIFGTNDSWKFKTGDYDSLFNFELGRTYYAAYFARAIQQHGARLELGGTAPSIPEDQRRDVLPSPQEIKIETKKIAQEFTLAAPAPDEQTLNERLADYVAERWSGVEPHRWEGIERRLKAYLGNAENKGTEENPAWVWWASQK